MVMKLNKKFMLMVKEKLVMLKYHTMITKKELMPMFGSHSLMEPLRDQMKKSASVVTTTLT